MVCEFECSTKYRKQLLFSSVSNWADLTNTWELAPPRKRKCKKPPPGYMKPTKTTTCRPTADARPRRPAYTLDQVHSAGPRGGNGPAVRPAPDNKEPVKCKVVNFTGTGTKLCVSSDVRAGELRAHSVPNVAEEWSEFEDTLSHRSVASTINLDSGKSQISFQKEQLLLQLHQRSASLVKYLFQDQQRSFQLHPDNISLPIRQPPRVDERKRKHVILEPKSDKFGGEDYLGALIPSRPLGYGLVAAAAGKELKVTHKTLEFPDRPRIILPSPSSHHHQPGMIATKQHLTEMEKVEDPSYLDSVSQLVGMLCIEPTSNSLPHHTISKWLDT